MTLIKTITKGKRTLGWIVATLGFGNVLVVRQTPRAIATTTKRKDFKSINDSAAHNQAGFVLRPELIRAIESHQIKQVAFYLPKTGLVYTTLASNYFTGGKFRMVATTKEGPKLRCVMLDAFTTTMYHVKL